LLSYNDSQAGITLFSVNPITKVNLPLEIFETIKSLNKANLEAKMDLSLRRKPILLFFRRSLNPRYGEI